jgi:hypothetical protein
VALLSFWFYFYFFFNGLELPYLFQEEWTNFPLLCGTGLGRQCLSDNISALYEAIFNF